MSSQQEKTLAIIKPTAFKKGNTGPILTQIEQAGFTIHKLQLRALTQEEAQTFYAIHRDKFFYAELCAYIASGPVVLIVLAKENAVADFRELIGATNPLDAAPHTLRFQFGESLDDNAIHGSDTPENATQEIALLFGEQS